MVYGITKLIVPPLFKYFVKEVKGKENILKKQAFVIASNHSSHLDQYFILSQVLPQINQKVHIFADKKVWFDNSKFKRWWAIHYEAIPIERGTDATVALDMAKEYLKKGESVLIYPEGGRTQTGELMKGKTGIARIVLECEVPIIPVGLKGTYELMPKSKKFPALSKRKSVSINFGKPLYFPEFYSRKEDPEAWREVTTAVMKEIALLSGQDYNF